MISSKKTSVSVHTDFQKLMYTENKMVSTKYYLVNQINVHRFYFEQCTPVY